MISARLAVTVFAAIACAQNDAPTGSMSGVVRDLAGGAPVANVQVAATSGAGKPILTATDAQGHYSFRGLAPGRISLVAGGNPADSTAVPVERKYVILQGGQDLQSVNLLVQGIGRLSGRVLDEDGKPVSGARVMALRREYSLGALRYDLAHIAITGKDGAYGSALDNSEITEAIGHDGVAEILDSLVFAGCVVEPPGNVACGPAGAQAMAAPRANIRPESADRQPAEIPLEAGRGYLLVAEQSGPKILRPKDPAPDPKARPTVLMPAWYLGSPTRDGASPMSVMPGESREHVDFRLSRGPAYCLWVALPAAKGPDAAKFQLSLSEAGFFPAMQSAFMADTVGTASQIHVCNLHPGDYRLGLAILPARGDFPSRFRSSLVTIKDQDVEVSPVLAPRVTVAGEVLWDGEAPAGTEARSLTILLRPLLRRAFEGESGSAKIAVPGPFTLASLVADEYALEISGIPLGAYVKDATYGGRSVLHAPLEAGSAADLRIVLARDGGRVSARVADSDGDPVADAFLAVMPAGAMSETTLADSMVTGRTDGSGSWTSGLLAPGSYLVCGGRVPWDKSPESVGQLLRLRTQAQEIDVAPGEAATAKIEMAK